MTSKFFGQGIKARASTSRNGINNSYARYNSKTVTSEQIKNRNIILNIDPELCIYCRDTFSETDDHLIPACNTRDCIFGQNNYLNRVPCCKKCNSSKGGKVNKEFKTWLTKYAFWSQKEIDELFIWIDQNKSYLYLEDESVTYLKKQHKIIDKIHEIMEESCKHKEEIADKLREYFSEH